MKIGILYAIAAAALFGASTPLAKLLLGIMPPVLLAGLLYLGSGLGLLVLRFWRQSSTRSEKEAALPRSQWLWLAGAVLFGGVLGPVLLMLGLRTTTAASSSLLLNFEGVFTALLAWFVFKENFDRRIALGMLAIVMGGIVLNWQPQGGLALSIGALLLLGASLPPFRGLFGALVVGFFGYGLSLACFVLALRHIGTARTGAFFSLAPFVGALVSLPLLREPVQNFFWFAVALMGIGVWLHLTEKHEHTHQHKRLEHSHSHVHDEHHRHAHAPKTNAREPHTHSHIHEPMTHAHAHFPDIHHRHAHEESENAT